MSVRSIREPPDKGWKAAAKQMLSRGRQYALWLYLSGQVSMAAGLSGIGAGAYFHNAWLILGGIGFGMHGFNRARRHILYRIDRVERLRGKGNNGNGDGPRLVPS